METARERPAPSSIHTWRIRSALAHDRGLINRLWRGRGVVEQPADADPEFIRFHFADLDRRERAAAAAMQWARDRVAHVQEAVGELELEVVRHVVGDTG